MMSALARLIAKARAAKAGAAAGLAERWSELETARRIAFLLDRADRAAAGMAPLEAAEQMVEDMFARADALIDADPAVAAFLAERFMEAASALVGDAGERDAA
jgi:hypothetical protein